MAVTQSTYPRILDNERELNIWLNLQKRINLVSEPNSINNRCGCCHQTSTAEDLDKADKHLIELPCPSACRFCRGCLVKSWISNFGPETSCPHCSYQFFQPFVEHWKALSNTISFEPVKAKGCCGICHEAYADGPGTGVEAISLDKAEKTARVVNSKPGHDAKHYAVQMQDCGHIFGRDCIESWLTPEPTGGNGNTCPTCRKQLFDPWQITLEDFFSIPKTPERHAAMFADATLQKRWRRERDFWILLEEPWEGQFNRSRRDRFIEGRVRELIYDHEKWEEMQERREILSLEEWNQEKMRHHTGGRWWQRFMHRQKGKK